MMFEPCVGWAKLAPGLTGNRLRCRCNKEIKPGDFAQRFARGK
jgi:hypothetical protein